MFAFSSATYSVGEGGGTVTVTVQRLNGSAGTAAVNYSTTGTGSAAAGSDYAAASGTLTFAAGQTTATFTVAILDDGFFEGDETFGLALSAPTNGAGLGSPNTAAVTITDNDAPQPGTVQFSGGTYTVNEGAGSASVTLTRTGGTDGAVTVRVRTVAGGTATAGSDYTAVDVVVTFAAGQASRTVSIPITDDAIGEGDETVNLLVSDATGGAVLGGQTAAVLTIVDNEAGTVGLSAAAYTVSENGGTVTVTVTRSGNVSAAGTVDYATANGTATAGADYAAAAGTLAFAANETTKTVVVSILQDALSEGTEQFTFALSNPTGGLAAGGTTSAAVSILDETAAFALSAAGYTVNENAGTVTVRVLRAGGSSTAAGTVTYTTQAGTATPGSDYTTTAGTATFAAGDTFVDVVVPILNDAAFEGNEQFTFALTGAGGELTTAAPASAAVTILDDESAQPGQLQLSAATYTFGEGVGTATFTVTRTGGSDGAVTANYATANGTATAGSDYAAASGTLTFAAGQTTATFAVAITNDAVDESDETFTVTLSAAGGGATLGAPAAATVTIADDDPAPTLAVSDVTVIEGGLATFTVTLAGATSKTVTVNYATANGTAGTGDYTAAAGTLTFAPGVTTRTFAVQTTDDNVFEGTESFVVDLSGLVNATAADAQGVGTITDNEAQPTLSVGGATAAEGASATFTVTLSGPSSQTVTVSYATADGTAAAGSDYTAASGTLTFAPGETTKTVTVATTQDAVDEADETFTVTLSGATNAAISAAIGVGTIADDDPAPTLAVSDVTVIEGGLATFTVTLAGATSKTVTVNYATANGTATAGTDYATAAGTLTFAPGETTKTVTVATTDDAAVEGTETFTLNLAGAANGTVADGQGVGTILDNDSANQAPTAAADSYTATEDTLLTVAAPGVLGNDADPDAGPLPLSAVLVSTTANGSLTLNPDGSFTYAPAANFNGTDSFTYRASDGDLVSGVATVTLTVTPVNDAPVAQNGSFTTAEDTPVSGAVLATDVDSAAVTYAVVSGPASGALTLNADGTFTYAPAANFNGPVTFTYRASDGLLVSNVATVTITVTPVNDPPVGAADSYATAAGQVLTVSAPGVLGNDTDVDGPSLTAVLVSTTSNGTLTLNANGSFAYAPAAGFTGVDVFTYRPSDGSAQGAMVTVTIAVNPVPTIEAVQISDGTAQRSMVQSVTVRFSTQVAIAPGAFTLTGVARDGSPIAVTVDVATAVVAGKTVATLTFRDGAGNPLVGRSLTDGTYTLTMNGALVTDAATGVPLDADGDGTPGGARAVAFHRFFGDMDGDRDVDNTDLLRMRAALLPGAVYVAALDYDGDGDVDAADRDQMMIRRQLGQL